jgi:nucleotide-binding universal stress UspA family protein
MSPFSGVAHILYLTDISAAAGLAWQHALMLAQRLNAQVHVLCWADRVGYTWTVPAASGAEAAGLGSSNLQQVTTFDAAEMATGGNGVDLVVLGLGSKETMEQMIYDSIPEVILRGLNCPLWVVGPRCRGTAPGVGPKPEAGTGITDLPDRMAAVPLRRILYATSLRHDGHAPALARYFAGVERGELTMLHVLPYSVDTPPDSPEYAGSSFAKAGEALAALVDDDLLRPVRVCVRSTVSRAELILSESSGSDLVVLPVPSLTAWTLVGGGTITQIVEEVRSPVLLVPEDWGGAEN